MNSCTLATHTHHTYTPQVCTHAHTNTCTHSTHIHNTTHTQACGSRWGALLLPIYREPILSIENIFDLSNYYSISLTGVRSRGGGTTSLLALPRLSRLLHPVLEPGG